MTTSSTQPQRTQSSPSAWYELLRFGRVLGTDPLPTGAQHWRQIKTPAGEKWANLNATSTYKFSDADFPAFLGWQFIADDCEGDSGADQRCDSEKLRTLLASKIEDKDQKEKALAKTSEGRQLLARVAINPDEAMKKKLRYLVCKFPSEFEQGNIDKRYGHIKAEEYFVKNPEAWDKLEKHIKSMTFNDLAPEYKNAQWHFHPEAFVNVMRGMWISPEICDIWNTAESTHALPNDSNLSASWKNYLYEYGVRKSEASIRDHTGAVSIAPIQSLDQRRHLIFGMRVLTDVNANNGRGLWDDRVTILKMDNTNNIELLYRGRYTSEPSGRYLDGGQYMAHADGENVGGSSHRDIGRLIANRAYEYQPFGRDESIADHNKFGSLRFGNGHFNFLRKTSSSYVERLVYQGTQLPTGQHISSANAAWQQGTTNGYQERTTMHFHQGYGPNGGTMTGSAGCQTFPTAPNDNFDAFMKMLEPMNAQSRFQYVLKQM